MDSQEYGWKPRDALSWLKEELSCDSRIIYFPSQTLLLNEIVATEENIGGSFRSCEYYDEFEIPKDTLARRSLEVQGLLSMNLGLTTNHKVYLIPGATYYLLGLLNSSLLRLYIHSVCTDLQGDSFNFSVAFVRRTPIRTIDFSDPAEIARHDRMVSLVEQMLSLHKQLQEARTPHEQTALQRQIDATDRQIYSLVYELYELTEEEKNIVERYNA